mmetsp:Transcript_9030/g.25201  ORF Transcript_9030/g.25201 Transcript_9030/m.25201 type:complete len:200 (+) Transcript_9030:653-1252(+)
MRSSFSSIINSSSNLIFSNRAHRSTLLMVREDRSRAPMPLPLEATRTAGTFSLRPRPHVSCSRLEAAPISLSVAAMNHLLPAGKLPVETARCRALLAVKDQTLAMALRQGGKCKIKVTVKAQEGRCRTKVVRILATKRKITATVQAQGGRCKTKGMAQTMGCRCRTKATVMVGRVAGANLRIRASSKAVAGQPEMMATA